MPTSQEIQFARLAIEQKFIQQNTIASFFTMQARYETQGKKYSLLEHIKKHALLSNEQIQRLQALQTTLTKVHCFDPGKLFAHYEIERELGRGGMGVVYKAYDTQLERSVALKVILQTNITEKDIQRFLLEAKATARLEHPNIVSVFEVGQAPQNYFAMEYIETGGTFSNKIKEGKLSFGEIAFIVQKIAEALHLAHKNKIVHRDIKPSNIMLDKTVPKLMDFGLVKVMDHSSLTEDVLGTPSYMSPEQIYGKNIGPASDIYSLGATLYESTKRFYKNTIFARNYFFSL